MEIKLTRSRSIKRLLLMVMRTFIFLLCTTVFSLSPKHVVSQNAKINIEEDKTVTVDEVFDIIRAQTDDYMFIYHSGLFKNFPKVELKKGVIRLNKLLNQSLSGGKLNIIVTKNNTILIKKKSTKDKHQQRQVSGKVTDEAGVPVVGATVLIKGTTTGTVTNFDGTYTITVPNPENVLVFSSLGFETQEITVGKQTKINVVLKEFFGKLNEVVVNAGYYTTTQKQATGSIAKLDAKTIEKQPVNNPLAAMQGHLAGVNIRQTTGVPGGGYEIEIRGRNFINGSTNPLFIVDGVPYGSQTLESREVSNQINQGNISPLNAINAGDIESIEVLKDADATAIYGSRGANGVVLITTKKGKAGKTRFNANVSTTLGSVRKFRDLMNTEEYLEVRREGVVNDGFGAFLDIPSFDSFWPDIKTWDQNRNTDWQEEFLGGTAYRNNAQLSVSGGSDQTQFLVSGAHQKETTVFPSDDDYKKSSVQININHQTKDNRFKLNFSTNYTTENNQLPRIDFSQHANTIEPNAPAIYDDAGNINWENNTFDNPLARAEEEYQVKSNTLFANTVVSYQVLSNLELKTNLGYNNNSHESYTILPNTARNPRHRFTPENYSHIITNSATRQSWIIEPQLNLHQQWGDLKLNALLGTTFQQETAQQLVQRGTGFPSNNLLQNLSAASTLEVLEDGGSEYKYQAFFGRINVNYKDKYILNITGRRDGSSRFGPSKQFGNFGAIGAAWVFSEEAVLKNSNILSYGKLRGSYGTTGSDNIGNYRFLDTYNTTGFDYNGTTTLQPTGIFNPLLAWEANKKLEVALELVFFKDRVLLNTSWYQNRSSNQLIGIPLAGTTGFSVLDGNLDQATVENTGFEVDLRTINLQSKNFKWTTTFNITAPKNKLLKFPGLENSTFADKFQIGKPLTMVRLFNALGVDPDTGLYQFEDYNNDGNISRLDDKQIIDDLAPKFYGGLGNTLSYKNLSLDFFFQFKKQKGYNHYKTYPFSGGRGYNSAELYNRWQEPGDISSIQRATAGFNSTTVRAGSNQGSSNAAISDASFIRLRNISLTYKVPTNNDMDLSVYLQGQNLLTITGYNNLDPEQLWNFILPPLQQFTLGLQLGF